MGGAGETAQAPRGSFLFVVNGASPTETAAPSEQRGRKRPHHKSRRGCVACKRRRVKCDERSPCSNCVKRREKCVLPTTESCKTNSLAACAPQPSCHAAVNDTDINLLHMELFYHFQRNIVHTLGFSAMWQHVLPWSFQEPYIMSSILCLAATHLSIIRPDQLKYSRIAVQLMGKSVSLFRGQLSIPVTDQNSEALIATSVLMQYISWSHTDFIEEQGGLLSKKEEKSLITLISQDPLFQLSSGVRGIFYEAFPVLCDNESVFISAFLYTPKFAIEEAVLQYGDDPYRFFKYFMSIWEDTRYRPLESGTEEELLIPGCADPRLKSVCAALQALSQGATYLSLPQVEGYSASPNADNPSSVTAAGPRELTFERISKRLSLLLSLASISASGGHPLLESWMHLQADIERCFFTFPVHCGAVFRNLVLQNDARALVMLYHFYRAARIVLTRPTSWWARQRSRIIESLIMEDLIEKGLDRCLLEEVWA